MLINKSGAQPLRSACASGVLERHQERAGSHRDKRAYARHPIVSCRVIAVRRLDNERKPIGRWFLADIVDVGEGGMGLIASEEQPLELGQWLLLDLRSHPGFGHLRLQAQLRWLSRAHFALAFGVAFATPLKDVPVLSPERRIVHRDPNEEDWALEEERQLAAA